GLSPARIRTNQPDELFLKTTGVFVDLIMSGCDEFIITDDSVSPSGGLAHEFIVEVNSRDILRLFLGFSGNRLSLANEIAGRSGQSTRCVHVGDVLSQATILQRQTDSTRFIDATIASAYLSPARSACVATMTSVLRGT